MAQGNRGRAGEKKSAIDDLKDELYSRERPPEIDPAARTELPASDVMRPPVAWADSAASTTEAVYTPPTPMKKNGFSFATKFLFVSAAFFVVAASVAGYIFFYGGNTISPQNIDMQIVSPSVIDGGKPAVFHFLINNRNQAPLQAVTLSINYPSGTRSGTNETQTLTSEEQTIGTLAPGQQIEKTSTAIFYGEEGAAQRVTATLTYSVVGSNSVFQKEVEGSFILGSSPVSVSISSPREAIAGQSFGIDVTATNNSTAPIQNFVLQGQYPFGFSVVSTNPQADTGGTTWRLGTLAPGASQTVHVSGMIDGQDGDERVFRFVTGSIADPTDTTIAVPLLVMPQTLTVRRPFVSARIALAGQSGKTVSIPGQQTVTGTVTWQNNLSVPVSSLEIRLTLSGPMLDPTSVSSANGFYQSQNSTIVWSKDQDGSLQNIAPGASGTEQFTFSTLAPGSGGTVYTNPVVDLNVAVAGVRQGQTGVPETVSSAATLQATVASLLSIDAQALHFSGPFTNSGPMPPVAEESTSYSIVWTVKNSSNTIANATVSATLPLYVSFISSAPNSGIQYDSSSRTVSWSLGDLKAGTGYSSPAQTGAFQVLLTPSGTQVGQSPALTNTVRLSGTDRFAQVGVSATAKGPTTQLTNDSGFNASMANVLQKQ